MVDRPAKSRRVYDKNRRALKRQAQAIQAPCSICGKPINYSAAPYEPDSFTADHIIPWHYSQDDSIHNLQVACRWCNTSKGKQATPKAVRRVETKQSREW